MKLMIIKNETENVVKENRGEKKKKQKYQQINKQNLQ